MRDEEDDLDAFLAVPAARPQRIVTYAGRKRAAQSSPTTNMDSSRHERVGAKSSPPKRALSYSFPTCALASRKQTAGAVPRQLELHAHLFEMNARSAKRREEGNENAGVAAPSSLATPSARPPASPLPRSSPPSSPLPSLSSSPSAASPSAVFMADGGLETFAAQKMVAYLNIFKTLLAPGGQYPYYIGSSQHRPDSSLKKRSTRVTTQPAVSGSNAAARAATQTDRRSVSGSNAGARAATARRSVSGSNAAAKAATARRSGPTAGSKPGRKHGWDWVATTSSPRGGSPEAIELSRETRSTKRKRVGEDV
ncbi:hypothetical protein FIBSPDRAFT_899340 [Athelia psychrophila]|uniref:Uncharacterized protein n=1 Tax=Athelia psychrophila TaxID=1759441 RepID=A0A165ZWI5_9AGAM|nr:hypothetical protein FIBSPDRAFT_899340 [Fibularhizoctonia sp. CBS 109695]